MQSFSIPLINEKIRSYNRISWIGVFLHFIIFAYAALLSTEEQVYKTGAAIIIALGIGTGILAYITRQKGINRSWMLCIYAGLAIGWIMMGNYLLAIIPIVFAALYFIATRDFVVTVSNELVTYPSFPEKKIDWPRISTLLLKDGLLTLELEEDKLIQQRIDENKTIVKEQDFNEFCKIQLAKAKS